MRSPMAQTTSPCACGLLALALALAVALVLPLACGLAASPVAAGEGCAGDDRNAWVCAFPHAGSGGLLEARE